MKLKAVQQKVNSMLNPAPTAPAVSAASSTGGTTTSGGTTIDNSGVPQSITIGGKTYDTGVPTINGPSATGH